MYTKVNDANFKEEVINSDIPVLADFWASWCRPCHMISPIVEELAKEYAGKLKVCKINIEEAPEATSTSGVTSIPTLAVFVSGKMIDRAVGALSKNELVEFLVPHI